MAADDCHRSILSDVILNRDVEYDGHLDMTAAEILSYIPKQKKLVDQEVLEAQFNLITEKSPEHCYYCPKNNFEDKAAYEKHMVLRILSFQGFDNSEYQGTGLSLGMLSLKGNRVG